LATASGEFWNALVAILVDTLRHESPYCVAAAARLLAGIARCEDEGKELIEESDAVPALLRVVEKLDPPSDLEKETGIFRKYAREIAFSKSQPTPCTRDFKWIVDAISDPSVCVQGWVLSHYSHTLFTRYSQGV
jgi:hypothetical protein